MGRITRLQNDIGHLNGVLAKKNTELAVARKTVSNDKLEISLLSAKVKELEKLHASQPVS